MLPPIPKSLLPFLPDVVRTVITSFYPQATELTIGHSMVFDARNHRLIIFAGKKRDAFLADVYSFDVTTQEVTEVISDFSALGGPDPCFAQRAAMDPESGHIYVCVVP